VTDGLDHIEIYTLRGLLTLLWHGPRDAESVVLMGGGAMGGLLGPGDGLFQDLGASLTSRGIGSIRMSYRRPNDLDACVHDMLACADLAGRKGASRFITMGHSFGGAVAINAAIALPRHCAGVVTLATQSAGCEDAARLGSTPLLLFHGDRDELLPPMVSEMVDELAGGHGELIVLEGTGHLMTEASATLREHLAQWVPERFAAHQANAVR
jgi:pimeloyl-ACP methyl ester carboxylesterase